MLSYLTLERNVQKQIKEKRYDGALKDYAGEILLVGISYEKKGSDRKHSCVIERTGAAG